MSKDKITKLLEKIQLLRLEIILLTPLTLCCNFATKSRGAVTITMTITMTKMMTKMKTNVKIKKKLRSISFAEQTLLPAS